MPYTFYIRHKKVLVLIEPAYFIDILMNHDILEAQNNY